MFKIMYICYPILQCSFCLRVFTYINFLLIKKKKINNMFNPKIYESFTQQNKQFLSTKWVLQINGQQILLKMFFFSGHPVEWGRAVEQRSSNIQIAFIHFRQKQEQRGVNGILSMMGRGGGFCYTLKSLQTRLGEKVKCMRHNQYDFASSQLLQF